MKGNQAAQLKEALELEGFLGKQRSGTFNIYQKRYCKFINDGQIFAFAESKEDFEKDKLSGSIVLKDILEIISEEKPRKFQLKTGGTIDKFEAATLMEKQKWVDAIYLCRAHIIQKEQKVLMQQSSPQKPVSPVKQEVKHNEDKKQETPQSSPVKVEEKKNELSVSVPLPRTASPTNNNQNNAESPQLKSSTAIPETRVTPSNVKSGEIIYEKSRSNEEYLRAKGLDSQLANIEDRLLGSRLMMGYVLKEAKEATGVGLFDDFVSEASIKDSLARRWCVLMSTKPLIYDQVDPSDEDTLENNQLPLEIEAEVLYVYDDACDNSKPLLSIPLKDVTDLLVKKKTPDEHYYRFMMKSGENRITFLLSNVTEMTTWVKAVQTGRVNAKEKTKSRLPIVKNLFWVFRIFAEQGAQKLKEKIRQDYELLAKNHGGDNKNIKDIVRIQEKAAEEFIAVINACLAHRDTRIDIIHIYVETLHEAILNTLRMYFKANQNFLENKDIFDILQFVLWYCGRLRTFDDTFVDQRMTHGITTLCQIVSIRVLKINMRSIKNIIKQESEKEPEIDGRGKVSTTAPNEVFKLFNETFNVLLYCNTKELSLTLLETCSKTLSYLQNGIQFLLENGQLTTDQLAGVCNNSYLYTSNLKDFLKQAEQLTGTSREIISQYFDEPFYNKAFLSHGKRACGKIGKLLCEPLCEQWEKISVLEIKLVTENFVKIFHHSDKDKSLVSVSEALEPMANKINSSLRSTLESACIQNIVINYVQAVFNQVEAKRLKSTDVQKLCKKLDQDQKFLARIFPNLKDGSVEIATKQMNDLIHIFASNIASIPLVIQNFKEEYGNALKYSTIDMFLKFRNDKLGKDRDATLRTWEEAYKTSEFKKENDKKFNVYKYVNQSFLDSPSTATSRSSLRPIDFDGSSSESDNSSDSGRSSSSLSNKSLIFGNMEGYLEATEALTKNQIVTSGYKYELKYFSIRRDILYYYKEKNSELSQGFYKLKEMSDCNLSNNDQNAFYMSLKSKDQEPCFIQFKTTSPESREKWLDALNQAKKLQDPVSGGNQNILDVQFFKDTRPLFANIEDAPQLGFVMELPPKKKQQQQQEPQSEPYTRSRYSQYDNRRDSMFGNHSARSSIASDPTVTPQEGEVRRKKSFDANGKVPRKRPVEKGCVAKICNIFGKSSTSSDYDYRPMK